MNKVRRDRRLKLLGTVLVAALAVVIVAVVASGRLQRRMCLTLTLSVLLTVPF